MSPVWTDEASVSALRAGQSRCTPSQEAVRCALVAPVSSMQSSNSSPSFVRSTCGTLVILQ